MRRPLAALVLVAAAATLPAACGGAETGLPDAGPAPPQRARLGWEESYGKSGARMVFRVNELEVLHNGWRAAISITNDTTAQYAIGDPKASLDRSFGLMLFPTGDLRELEQRNQAGELPAVRTASRFTPALPLVLEPGGTWTGTISAHGSLAAGLFARVVFGALVPVGESPDGLPGALVWITDHAYRLKEA
jgi:hypothetical protein